MMKEKKHGEIVKNEKVINSLLHCAKIRNGNLKV